MSFYVLKRNGRRESVHFDKITSRISKLCYGLDPKVRFSEAKLPKRANHAFKYLRFLFSQKKTMV